jgi:NADH-quinone oxidoreductase subunit A
VTGAVRAQRNDCFAVPVSGSFVQTNDRSGIDSAPMTPTAIVAYLAIFAAVGFSFVLVSLCLGWLVRAKEPNPRKLEIYECGEPSIGPGTIQFDLRFYVVALLFLIFEVEVAFFFPPATIFGEANRLRAAQQQVVNNKEKPAENAVSDGTSPNAGENGVKCYLTLASARTLALTAMVDLGVFFAVLLVGFAYIWRRGDLEWVRATRHPRAAFENATPMRLRRSDPV